MKKVILVGIIVWLSSHYLTGQNFNIQLYKYSKVLRLIDNYYVDTVNLENIVETSIVEMLKVLDPHSVYYSKDEVKALNEPLQGNFEGVGIQFNILEDTLMVVTPIAGGPSEKVGIKSGDRIIFINKELIAGKSLTNKGVRDRLLGKKGTKVKLKIKRKGVAKLLDFTVTRDKIPIYSIDAAYAANHSTGYIKLSRFARTTMNEFYKALEDFKEKRIKNLILDLRDNGGGYLDIAVQLADEFLSKDKMIVYTKGLKSPKSTYFSTNKGYFHEGKVVVLIDEGSASASEILSGAIQDWDRGIVIGRRSFGKGLVQKQYGLPDGSMMRLTVSQYHTPTGRLIQKPYNQGVEDYAHELLERHKHGELFHADSIRFPDSLKYRTLVSGRTVYGGGGIMPDLFIPIDTSGYSNYYRDLVRKGIFYDFVLKYMDQSREGLKKKYKEFSKFNKKFKVSDEDLKTLIEFAKNEGVEFDTKGFEVSKEDMKMQLKALIARDTWENSCYYEVMNTRDKIYNKALNVINNWEKYENEVLKK